MLFLFTFFGKYCLKFQHLLENIDFKNEIELSPLYKNKNKSITNCALTCKLGRRRRREGRGGGEKAAILTLINYNKHSFNLSSCYMPKMTIRYFIFLKKMNLACLTVLFKISNFWTVNIFKFNYNLMSCFSNFFVSI